MKETVIEIISLIPMMIIGCWLVYMLVSQKRRHKLFAIFHILGCTDYYVCADNWFIIGDLRIKTARQIITHLTQTIADTEDAEKALHEVKDILKRK